MMTPTSLCNWPINVSADYFEQHGLTMSMLAKMFSFSDENSLIARWERGEFAVDEMTRLSTEYCYQDVCSQRFFIRITHNVQSF